MIQTFYITISCENRKKERKFPTRIKLNHIGLPEGKGGNSFFSFFFFGGGGSGEWGGHHRSGWGGAYFYFRAVNGHTNSFLLLVTYNTTPTDPLSLYNLHYSFADVFKEVCLHLETV